MSYSKSAVCLSASFGTLMFLKNLSLCASVSYLSLRVVATHSWRCRQHKYIEHCKTQCYKKRNSTNHIHVVAVLPRKAAGVLAGGPW